MARSGRDQTARAFTKKLDKLADHLVLAQQLRHGQYQVGGRYSAAQLACELHADDIGREQIHRLAEHGGFGFDTTDPPANHTHTVNHGGVAVGTDQGIGVINTALWICEHRVPDIQD